MSTAARIYEISRSAEEKFDVRLSAPALKAEGLHLQTWGSSYVLANLLHRLTLSPETHENGHSSSFDILELGAGTGLVGLSAAVVWASRVVLTDLSPILPGIAANVNSNQKLLMEHRAQASCGSLDWKNPSNLAIYSSDVLSGQVILAPDDENKPSIILAADTMYTEEHPMLLSRTIFTWLRRGSKSRAIVCYPMRMAYLDDMQNFWTLMEKGGMEVVEEGREELDEDSEGDRWDDERLHEWSVWRWKEP
ncbi:hypothetical protein MMC10_005912 [Thelotrema lepadinum]|nr:hypothetical protein [Thelotrema lepadinum]